jgi:tetratricopeptide (TPR) repeat protein
MRLLVVTLVAALGLALTGGPVLAQGAVDKVKEANIRAAKDYLKHGLMLADEGRDDKAAESFRKAVSLRPDWAEARSLLGSSLARAGKYAEAEEQLRKAVSLDPNYAEGWYFLGLFLKDRGKTAEAEECFRKAKQLAR